MKPNLTIASLITSLVLAITPISLSSPISGHTGFRLDLKTKAEFEEKFYKGGERASVIVWSQNDDIPVKLSVYNNDNKLVAQDIGRTALTVVWYPPRDEVYHIVLENLGDTVTTCYCALK